MWHIYVQPYTILPPWELIILCTIVEISIKPIRTVNRMLFSWKAKRKLKDR